MLFSSSTQAQYTDEINANRPGKSMGGYAVGLGVYQVEAGYSIWSERDKALDYSMTGRVYDLSLRGGFWKEELELLLDLQYQNDKVVWPDDQYQRGGLRQTYIGAKYLVYDPFKRIPDAKKVNLLSWNANHKFKWRELLPAVSVYAGAHLSIGSNPYFADQDKPLSPKVVGILQNHLGLRYVLVTNLIASKLLTKNFNLGAIVTLTRGFSDDWSGMVEWQYYSGLAYTDNVIRVGAAYKIHDDLQVDVNMNRSLKTAPEMMYGGFGLAWRFDDNLGIHWTRVDKKDKKDKNDKKDKKDKKKKDKKDRKKADKGVDMPVPTTDTTPKP